MVKLLGRLRKKKTSYVEVDKHSKVSNAFNEKNTSTTDINNLFLNEAKVYNGERKSFSTRSMRTFRGREINWGIKSRNNDSNNQSFKERDTEQLSNLSTRSMSTVQKGEIPWTSTNKETNPQLESKPAQTKNAPIAKISSQLISNQLPTNSRTSNNIVPQVNTSTQATPTQAARVFEIHPAILREMPKPSPKPTNQFEEEALNEKYDLIPTKVRNAPFGRCYFARHRESKNVVLIALILQHVFDRFQGKHGDLQLIELMKSADPNLRGLREKIQCSGSVALVMDVTLSELSKSETMPVQNGARSKVSNPSTALGGGAEIAMDQRDEEDEIDDFLSELDSTWTARETSQAPTVDPRKKKINSEHFRKGVFSFETYEQFENREDKTNEKSYSLETEPRDDPSGREEFLAGEPHASNDSNDDFERSRRGLQHDRQNRSRSAPKRRTRQMDDEMREEVDEVREMPDVSSRSRRQKMRPQSSERGRETREKIRRRRKKELSERRRSRTKSKGRDRMERDDSVSSSDTDGTSVIIRPVPPKNLTLWKLLTSLELADCMPLAALDETMDFGYGREESSTRSGRTMGRHNTFDTCESSSY